MSSQIAYKKLVERLVPIARIAFIHKDIINQNLEMEELESILLKRGASNNKFNDLKEEAKNIAVTSTSSYYDILKDLINNEILKLNENNPKESPNGSPEARHARECFWGRSEASRSKAKR